MTLQELRNNLETHDIPESWYSIDSVLKEDAYNIRGAEFFYFERGQTDNYRIYLTAEDAYDYLWEILKGNLILNKKR